VAFGPLIVKVVVAVVGEMVVVTAATRPGRPGRATGTCPPRRGTGSLR
jgi:hypothetical protein